jgi:dihydrodipicolinate synthase/N-acetylneuraminate lyase
MAPNRLSAETLQGIWAGVTLSWQDDYSFDEASFRENLRRLCNYDVAGIYTTGSTGEFYVLDWPEFQHMVDVFLEVVGPADVPTQVGCCADDTRDVLRMVEYVAQKGAGGAQITLPYWMKLTDQEMLQFFKDVYTAVPELPLIHYNIPRTKRFLTGPDYLRVLEVAPSLIGVKFTFASSHFGDLQRATQLTPGLSYFVSENVLVSAMQVGARGCYSSLVCTNPDFMLKLFDLAQAGKWEEALEQQSLIVRFFGELGKLMESQGMGGMDPVVDKGMAVASGLLVGHQRTRPPYIGWSDNGVRRVRQFFQERYPMFIPDELATGSH